MASPPLTAFERSARKDVVFWISLLIGAVFIFAAWSVDPQKNCDESGKECAPWLVPIAGIMGWCAVAMGLGQLVVNPRRGYAIDAETGDLVWWKNRTSRSKGDTGRIHPAHIASIRINRRLEDESISLIGDDGERLAYFDEDLIAGPYDRWAEQFRSTYPHVRIEILD